MAALETRLLLTLLYSWSFHFPLRVGEWYQRLYRSFDTDELDSCRSVAAAMRNLLRTQVVTLGDNTFFPTKGVGVDDAAGLGALRRERAHNASQKLAELRPLIQFCRRLPWVLGVAVTGSVAVGNAKSDDDLDLMIVCGQRRLWLVRPLLILFSQYHGKRRTWHGEEGNSWCFNLWCEPSSLRIGPAQRSLYTAYEVCQAQWLISKGGMRALFAASNKWVATMLPTYYQDRRRQQATFESNEQPVTIPVYADLMDVANLVAYQLQRAYMKRRMTRERVSLDFAAFHPRDTRGRIMQTIETNVGIMCSRR